MGSPRRQRKKFTKPSHPWQKERILAEKDLLKGYGLRRKYEIWKMNTILKNFTRQAKNLITSKGKQSERETSQLLTKLSSLGLIDSKAKVEDVLGLTLKDVMERRLQTLVFKKNLARSLKQARQLIIHQHISIGDKKITAPSYLVPLSEETEIKFVPSSSFSDLNHPERKVEEKPVKKKKTAKEKEKPEEPKKEAKAKEEKKAEKETKEKKAEDKKSAKEAEAPKQNKKEAKEQKQEEKKQDKN